MYVKTWLPSNPQQQLMYSFIHLVIALSNKNSTFPRRHFWKRSHQSSLSVPLAATHHGCAIENESGLKKTLWFLDYIIQQQLVDILLQQVSSPDNYIYYANIAQSDEDDNKADVGHLLN